MSDLSNTTKHIMSQLLQCDSIDLNGMYEKSYFFSNKIELANELKNLSDKGLIDRYQDDKKIFWYSITNEGRRVMSEVKLSSIKFNLIEINNALSVSVYEDGDVRISVGDKDSLIKQSDVFPLIHALTTSFEIKNKNIEHFKGDNHSFPKLATVGIIEKPVASINNDGLVKLVKETTHPKINFEKVKNLLKKPSEVEITKPLLGKFEVFTQNVCHEEKGWGKNFLINDKTQRFYYQTRSFARAGTASDLIGKNGRIN